MNKSIFKAIRIVSVAILSVLLYGCSKENFGKREIIVPDLESEDMRMTLVMDVPYAYATKSLEGEDKTIETVDILVFKANDQNGTNEDNETFLYATHGAELAAAGGKTQFKVYLKKSLNGEFHRIVVLGNLRAEVSEALKNDAAENKTKREVLEMIKFKAYEDGTSTTEAAAATRKWDTSTPRYLPMWGQTKKAYVVTESLASIDEIPMLRSVAAVDLVINPQGSENTPAGFAHFELKDIKVYNVTQEGYISPFTNNYTITTLSNKTTIEINNPSVPSSVVRDRTIKVAYQATSPDEKLKGVKYSIYIPEAINDGLPIEAQTCLVVSGTYTDPITNESTFGWYRLDFIKEQNTQKRHDIKRNSRYTFLITSVDGPGYPNEIDAFESRPMNMEVGVVDWVDDMDHVTWDKNYYMGVSPKIIDVWAAAAANNTILMKTDYEAGWNYRIDFPEGMVDKSWLTVKYPLEADRQLNGLFPNKTTDPAGPNKIIFDIKQLPAGSIEGRKATIVITAGRMEIPIPVDQQIWQINSIDLTNIVALSYKGETRTVKMEGAFEDTQVRAIPTFGTNDPLDVATVPGGTSSTAPLKVPHFWDPHDRTVNPGQRVVAFDYLNPKTALWQTFRTLDQPGSYIKKVTPNNQIGSWNSPLTVHAGYRSFGITVEGCYPDFAVAVVDKNTFKPVGTVQKISASPSGGTYTASDMSCNYTYANKTVYYGYLEGHYGGGSNYESGSAWRPLGAVIHQPMIISYFKVVDAYNGNQVTTQIAKGASTNRYRVIARGTFPPLSVRGISATMGNIPVIESDADGIDRYSGFLHIKENTTGSNRAFPVSLSYWHNSSYSEVMTINLTQLGQ